MVAGVFIVWAALGALCGIRAERLGPARFGFFFFAMLFSPLVGFLALELAGPTEETERALKYVAAELKFQQK